MKNQKIRTIYGVIFLAYTVLLGMLAVVKALTLYASGGYTESGVRDGLTQILPFALAWVALVCGGVIIYALFPVENKTRVTPNVRAQIARMEEKLPEDAWTEGRRALKKYTYLLWGVTGGVLAVLFFFPMCYLLNPKHFNYTDTNTEMAQAALHTLPFIAAAFVVVIVAYLVYGYLLKKSLKEVKALTAQAAKSGTLGKGGAVKVQETWLDNPKTLWIVRWVLLVAAIALTVFGVVHDGPANVFAKAAQLCMECVGLA